MGVGKGGNIPDNAETLFRFPYPEHIECQRRYPHEGTVAVVPFARASGFFRGHAFFQAFDGFRSRVAHVKHLAVWRVGGLVVPFGQAPRDTFKVRAVSACEQIIRQSQGQGRVVGPCSGGLVMRAVALHIRHIERPALLELHRHAQRITHGHAHNQRQRPVIRLFVKLAFRAVKIYLIRLAFRVFVDFANPGG